MKEAILTAPCDEPGGRVVRSVYSMDLTVENLKRFWELSKPFKYLFNKEISNDFKTFCELFLYEGKGGLQSNGLFWVVDDFVGIFYMDNIRHGVSRLEADVHYTFFDRRHRGRTELVREMVKYLFCKYNFQRLNAEIPLYAKKGTFEFATAVGFRREGRRRKAQWHNDDWFDVLEFGILKDEALKS